MADVRILHYQAPDGRIPYREWFASLEDRRTKAAVLARTDRLAFGAFGDWKAVGDGVFELRVHFGPGLRIYFGRRGDTVVILLCGGDKRSQARDIRMAKDFWRDYEARTGKPSR